MVAFDERAAVALGSQLPMDVLKEVADRSGLKLSYLKFDALIVASAIRYNADVLVSLDAGVHALAKRCGLRCAYPEEFEDKARRQLTLVAIDGGQKNGSE